MRKLSFSLPPIGSNKVKIITQRNQKGIFQRLNTKKHHLKYFKLSKDNRDIRFMLVDTPSHAGFLREAELGMQLSIFSFFHFHGFRL